MRLRAVAFALLTGLFLFGCAKRRGPQDIKVARAQYDLARDAFVNGRYRQALEFVGRSLESDDENPDVHYLGAMVHMVFCAHDAAGPDCRWSDAENYLQKALKLRPDMRDAKNALGVVLVHRKRPAEAIVLLRELAHDILYRSPEKAWGNLGWAYLEAGQVDDAIPALERAIAAQPMFCVGHYRLGLAYEKKNEYKAAKNALTRALKVSEGGCGRMQEAFLVRARVGIKLGLLPQVQKDLQQCQKLAAFTVTGKACTRKLASLH
jgi:type IV pilus assembly protein PilF